MNEYLTKNLRNFKTKIYKDKTGEYMKLSAIGSFLDEDLEIEVLKIKLDSLKLNLNTSRISNRGDLGNINILGNIVVSEDMIAEFKCFPVDSIYLNLKRPNYIKNHYRKYRR